MNSKRYVRLLLVVVLTLVIALIGLVGRDEVIDLTGSALKLGNFNTNKPPKVKLPENIVSIFPLDESLTKPQLYSPQRLRTFGDPLKLPQKYVPKVEAFDLRQTVKMCSKIFMSDSIDLSENKLLPAELELILSQIWQDEHAATLLKEAQDHFQLKLPVEAQWFRFFGSSVWLEEFKVHYLVSRLIYSPLGIPNKGFASFLYVQIFDQNWQEITAELDVPYERTKPFSEFDDDYDDTDPFEPPEVNQLLHRKIKFPSLLPINFRYAFSPLDRNFWGPEDPRIIKRLNPNLGFEEPIIVFNLKSLDIRKRVMHLYIPFSDQLRILRKRYEKYANIEKNWTPFISNKQSNDTINFVYSFSPLEVLNCEVDTGLCDFLQKADKSNINHFGVLRGATQLEQFPIDELPDPIRDKFKVAHRSIYIGWSKTHLNKCGCGESMYRPNLVILTEDYNPNSGQFFYKINGVSESIDFNADIPPWFSPKFDADGNFMDNSSDVAQEKPICDKSSRNVLAPNSIAYWSIKDVRVRGKTYKPEDYYSIPNLKNVALEDIHFNDFMGVTLSAADNDVSVTHVKGLVNYILGLDSLFDPFTVITSNETMNRPEISINEKCGELAAKKYCLDYARVHGGPIKY